MAQLLHLVIDGFVLLLILRVVFSWIPSPPSPLDKVEYYAIRGTEWICGPVRRLIPPLPLGAIQLDLSVIVVFFLAQLAHSFVNFLF